MSPIMSRLSKADLKKFVHENGSNLRLSVGSETEMKSQNERAKHHGKNYITQVLKKVSADDKDSLFASIKKDKGRNQIGGVYGSNNGINYGSPAFKSTAGSSGF